VHTPELRFALGGIWIGRPEIDAFIGALERLEATRREEAVLESQSPGELLLAIAALDGAGHMTVRISARRTRWDVRQPVVTEISTSFEFDPSSLPAMARSVRVCTNR
jgi:hypothetical protein